MLYHFGVPGFGLGLDKVAETFFRIVISGFLMTGIVVRGLERGAMVWFVASFYMAGRAASCRR